MTKEEKIKIKEERSKTRIKEASKLGTITNDLNLLLKNRLIMKCDSKYYIKKIAVIKKHFENLSNKERKEYSENILSLAEWIRGFMIDSEETFFKCSQQSIYPYSTTNIALLIGLDSV